MVDNHFITNAKHYAVYLKLTQCGTPIVSQKLKEKEKTQNTHTHTHTHTRKDINNTAEEEALDPLFPKEPFTLQQYRNRFPLRNLQKPVKRFPQGAVQKGRTSCVEAG